jgi:hypothetical protein
VVPGPSACRMPVMAASDGHAAHGPLTRGEETLLGPAIAALQREGLIESVLDYSGSALVQAAPVR